MAVSDLNGVGYDRTNDSAPATRCGPKEEIVPIFHSVIASAAAETTD
jgi:hypothetical protein